MPLAPLLRITSTDDGYVLEHGDPHVSDILFNGKKDVNQFDWGSELKSVRHIIGMGGPVLG